MKHTLTEHETTAACVELAIRRTEDGGWDYIADLTSLEEAKKFALEHTMVNYANRDAVVYGVTEDPNGGHYEHTIVVCIDETNEWTVHID